jgi:hypothetical protein
MVGAAREIAKRCKIRVPSKGFSHVQNHFSHSSLELPVLRWQTILWFVEKKRRQRLVPPLYDASKPLIAAQPAMRGSFALATAIITRNNCTTTSEPNRPGMGICATKATAVSKIVQIREAV